MHVIRWGRRGVLPLACWVALAGCRADEGVPVEGAPLWQPLEAPPESFPAVQVTGTWRHPLWLSTFERYGASFAAILDEEARVVWAQAPQQPEGRILRMRSAVDGGVIWAEGHRQREVEFGTIGRQDWTEADPEYTRAPFVHHELIERDGGYLFLAHELDVLEGHPTTGDDVVAQDVVAWVPRGATSEVLTDVRFRVADHLDFSAPCSHVLHDQWVPDAWDWTHVNSMVEDGDDLWLMVRYHDQVWRLDGDFALVERIGGVDGDPLAPGELPLSHSHISHVRDGRLVVVDNRNHDGPARALALSRGAEGWQSDWQIPGTAPLIALGDAQLLDDGSVVVAWGTEGRIDAYDADGVWEGSLTLPEVTIGRIEVRPPPDWAR
jgi:hypothetical protein